MNLNDAIVAFNQYRASSGYSPNTVRSGAEALAGFMAVTGNIRVKSLDTHHGEMYLAQMLTKGYKPTTINLRIAMVSSFCKWARLRRYLPANANPLATVRSQVVEAEPRRRVPVHEFDRLLEAADHPQSRMIVALGLYLFLRSSEVVGLKLGDVDLDAGELKVYQPKTKRWDVMPICAELDTELRRWLTWYATDQPTRLSPSWFLVPARRQRNFATEHEYVGPEMAPERRLTNTSRKIHDALRGLGWDVDGKDMEGCHTLRRSGARALFDELEGRSRDGALRYVASMLHHRSVTQTEHYLGLDVDKEKRDVLLRGERMFTQIGLDNVIPITGDLRAADEA